MNIKGSFFNGSVKINLNFKRFFNGNTDFVAGNISLGWIVDSGANQQMTVSAKILVNVVDIYNLGLTVGYPNETQALITKIGDLKINNNITLYDVLVVPEYTISLLSVHKLSRDNKLFVGFNENNCYIRDLKANKTVGIGRQFNGLYLFDVDNACKIVSNYSNSSCFISKILWHQRLGHPVDLVLDALKSSLNLDSHSTSDHLCDTCNKAKQTREPFPLSDHKSSKIGKDDVYDSINGIAERKHRHLLNVARYLMFHEGLPLYLWSECVLTAVYIINKIPSSVLSGKSPYYFVYGHDPSLSHFRVFGCLCYATILNNQDKFSSRSERFKSQKKIDKENPRSPNDEGRVSSNDDGTELSPDNNQEFNSDVEELPVNTLRRSSRQTKLPSSLNDFIIEGKVKYGVERVVSYANLNHENSCFASSLNKSIEPTCYEEAVLDSNWIDAMNAEIEALNENHTWVITNLPPGRKAIGNKWIFEIKYKSSGDIDRYKARLVVKGFNQKEGIDFDETFSPVVKMSTVRCVIALSVTNNWPLFQLDFNNAFLYGDLDEDIYMTIPKGFASKDNKNKACKLVKSLYGLKQAPRKWNEKHVTILKENDFVQSANDHSFFTKSKDNKFIALLVYVDDIVATGNCVKEIDNFKAFLKSKFKIKDLGHLKYFLGIEVIKTDKDLCLSQRKYCLELLKEYGLLGCKPVSTPMEPNSVLSYTPSKDDPLLDNITGYQKLLGKLIYLTHTRPDIAYSVHCLAQYMHSPLKSHLNCALNVLRYLKNAPGKGIRYKYPGDMNSLCGYSDADWAKCLKTIKSVTEAEYRSLSSAAYEIFWIQKLLLDLKTKVTLPIDLHCDNKCALQLAINPVFHERSKHFEIDVHFIREKIAKGLLNTKKIFYLRFLLFHCTYVQRLQAFRDDNELPKGEEISPHLYKATIEESRTQTRSYAEAFAKHELLNSTGVEKWKEARQTYLDGISRTSQMGAMVIKQRLSCKPVLLVLDDVDDHEQLEALAGSPTWFCQGSLIIFTGKDKLLLRSHRVDEIHDMDFLDEDQSLELFCSFAFEGENPSTRFKEVSNKVVKYVQGHPLALKVWGRFLYGKTVGQWVSELDRLKLHPNEKIQSLLRLSYDGLNLHQQNILLDIACIFIGENSDFVTSILDGCNFFADTNMRVLVDKSLITISNNMSLQMHDLIQAMARAIVREESIMPGKQRRLLISSNVYDISGQHKVAITEAVEVLVLSLEKFSQKVHIDANDFAHMKKLRILKIYQEEKVYEQKLKLKGHNVIFSGNFNYLSNELSLFYWHGYPFKYLPSNFYPENIVAIDLCYSNVKDFWTAPNCFRRLKVMKLRVEIDALQVLNLMGCLKVDQLPQALGQIKSLTKLHVDRTTITQLPSFVSSLINLESLSFGGQRRIQPRWWTSITGPFGLLSKQQHPQISLSLVGLHMLKYLNLSYCNLLEVSESIGGLSCLVKLHLEGNNFTSLPGSLSQLSSLKWLNVDGCKKLEVLPELPPGLYRIHASDCTSLREVSGSSKDPFRFRNNHFRNCPNLFKNATIDSRPYCTSWSW
ncbi:NB-ARC domains-containing protein [Tanacetum coccineum]|uniref:NB-ARC domains-containing protein n=1 Tax=Tanacetum coccineum TaxID=301880 RepID=A0ABQ4YM80_9ASTR